VSVAKDTELSQLMSAARDAVLSAAGDHQATPDFAETVQRAHQIDHEAVPMQHVEAARALAEVLPMRAAALEPGPVDAEFGDFLSDVVTQRDEVAAKRRLGSIPATPGIEAPSSRRGWAVGLLAAAAVVAIGFGLGSFARTADQAGADDQIQQAVHQDEPEATTDNAQHREPDPKPSRAFVPAPIEADPPPTVEPEETAEEAEPQKVAKPRPSKDAEMKQLDAEAQARWRAGDLPGAEAKFRELIRRAPSRHWVELAYGDLFPLARQAHGAEYEQRLWAEYLRNYPRGRHADDARAGLCRRTTAGDERDACWTEYLADFPRGAHRKQATADAP
jgi:hypothetical protein